MVASFYTWLLPWFPGGSFNAATLLHWLYDLVECRGVDVQGVYMCLGFPHIIKTLYFRNILWSEGG